MYLCCQLDTFVDTGGSTVPCLSLTNPKNGVMTCSLGDDEIPSYEDTCSFTCNTGYTLTGSVTRTCQSDGSWSGSETSCRKGRECVKCFVQVILYGALV